MKNTLIRTLENLDEDITIVLDRKGFLNQNDFCLRQYYKYITIEYLLKKYYHGLLLRILRQLEWID